MSIEEVIAKAGVIARRVAGPLRPFGIVTLAAGMASWLMLGLPVWGEGTNIWVGSVLFVVLALPGAWLLFHRWWLERAFRKAEQLVPDATTVGRTAFDAATSRDTGSDDQREIGRLRTAYRFYRKHLGPLRKQSTDLVQNAISISQPLMPWVLITTAVALGAGLLLLVLVPLATLVRALLLAT